jgi:hypothetical protein
MTLRRLMLAGSVIAASSCYTFQPAELDELSPGTAVRLRLSPESAEQLQEVRMTEERLMDGSFVERQGDRWLFSTPVVGFDPTTGGRTLSQVVALDLNGIRDVELKRLDRARTGLLIGAGAAVVSYFIVSQLQDGAGSQSGPEPGLPESPRVRVPLLRLSY